MKESKKKNNLKSKRNQSISIVHIFINTKVVLKHGNLKICAAIRLQNRQMRDI